MSLFFLTVTDVVYPALLEVLKNDAKRLKKILHCTRFKFTFFINITSINCTRLLHFKMHEDSSHPVFIVAEQASLTCINSLPRQKKSKKQRRAEAAKLKQATYDFLHAALFLNFYILVLERMKHHYESKQHIMDDVAFLFPISVSFVFPVQQCIACEHVLY